MLRFVLVSMYAWQPVPQHPSGLALPQPCPSTDRDTRPMQHHRL